MGLATPKPDPTILLHPNIPKPLHKLAPRVIYGDTWWDGIKTRVKASQNYACAACGRLPGVDPEAPYLSCHEIYNIDYEKQRAYYVRTVALCTPCHLFIHSGFLQTMVDNGKMAEERQQMIMDRGTRLLREAGLIDKWIEKQRNNRDGGFSRIGNWANWRLVLDGKEYGPKFKSYEEWYEHFNGKKPPTKPRIIIDDYGDKNNYSAHNSYWPEDVDMVEASPWGNSV